VLILQLVHLVADTQKGGNRSGHPC